MYTRSLSPLRYPGGKAGLFFLFNLLLKWNNLAHCTYYEPFAGGAGCALQLLESNSVDRIVLNDADPSIYSFWFSILHHQEQFIESINSIPITVDEWKRQKNILLNSKNCELFDVGFAVFYLNRCSRSGILSKSGPIGGYKQLGKWKMDARFNRDTLTNRIIKIGTLKDKIEIYNLEAIDFMKICFMRGSIHRKFVYLDPPYIGAGKRLYFNNYASKEHIFLSKYIQRYKNLKWVMTYDCNEFIKKIYGRSKRYKLCLNHSLQTKHNATEYLFASGNIEMPDYYKFNSKHIQLDRE